MASADTPSPTDADRGSWPRFQFSLKTLLIVATVLAVLLGVGNLLPAVVQVLLAGLLLVVILPALLVTAVSARGPPQAFAQGVLGTTVVWQVISPLDSLLEVPLWLVGCGLSGMVAIFVREWLRLQGWDQAD